VWGKNAINDQKYDWVPGQRKRSEWRAPGKRKVRIKKPRREGAVGFLEIRFEGEDPRRSEGGRKTQTYLQVTMQ